MRIKLPLSLTNFTHEKFANHSESPRLAFKIFIVSPPTSRVVYYTSKLLESVAVLNLLI